MTDLFYTLEEAAERLRRCTKGVRQLVANGQLERDPTSRRVLIVRRSLDTFAERRGKSSTPTPAKK